MWPSGTSMQEAGSTVTKLSYLHLIIYRLLEPNMNEKIAFKGLIIWMRHSPHTHIFAYLSL